MLGVEMNPRYLPREIITQILVRVRAKDVGRFNAVSKQWLSIISHPEFVKAHLARVQPQFMFETNTGGMTYCTDAIDESENNATSEMRVERFQFPFEDKMCILDSCCGLLLLLREWIERMYIFNPVTRKIQELPLPDKYEKVFHWALVYDDSLKRFKVFGIHKTNNMMLVLTVEEIETMMMRGWRELVPTASTSSVTQDLYRSSWVFAAAEMELHWLVQEFVQGYSFNVIHSVDIATEEHKLAVVPSYIPKHCRTLSVVKGSLCLMNHISTYRDTLQVWVLEDRVNCKWSKMYDIYMSCPPFLRTMGNFWSSLPNAIRYVSPREGYEWPRYNSFAMTNRRSSFSGLLEIMVTRKDRLFLYDVKNHNCKQLAFFNKGEEPHGHDFKGLYWSHFNSLVSWE